MGIHREGTATLLLATAILCFALYGLMQWTSAPAALRIALAAPLVIIFLILLWFFRVPRRTTTMDDGAIVSPADGRVVAIEEVHEPEHFNDRRLQVSIFMSPLNVHVNWYPVAGTVSYARYHPGKYLVAWHPKSSTEPGGTPGGGRPARHGGGPSRQPGGALARRICTYSTAGANAAQGREFGFIKFGSRVDLFLPLGSKVQVALGDTVQGSTTVIARFPNA